MILIKIKVKKENKSFAKIEPVSEDFVISKANQAFEQLVYKTVLESGLENPDVVKISISFEW